MIGVLVNLVDMSERSRFLANTLPLLLRNDPVRAFFLRDLIFQGGDDVASEFSAFQFQILLDGGNERSSHVLPVRVR